MWEVAIAIVLAGAIIALVLALRRPPGNGAEIGAVRSDLNLLRQSTESSVRNLIADVNSRLDAIHQNVAQRLSENVSAITATSQAVGERMDRVQSTFAELQRQVGEMSQQARHLAEVSQSLAGLENILSAPKLRGGFGETQLEALLSLVFAREQYELQYSFRSGDIADAVLRFPQGMLAIDSKFSLENFRRMASASTEAEKKSARREFLKDVRRRIDEISAKYIRPAEGTLPLALMYVPAENVYYEAIIRDEDENDLHGYCAQKRVLAVSPNSLYAYLQTILVGLNGMRISKRAEFILREIESLRIELDQFSEAYGKVGAHLKNASDRLNDSSQLLSRVETRVRGLGFAGADETELPQEQSERVLGAGER